MIAPTSSLYPACICCQYDGRGSSSSGNDDDDDDWPI